MSEYTPEKITEKDGSVATEEKSTETSVVTEENKTETATGKKGKKSFKMPKNGKDDKTKKESKSKPKDAKKALKRLMGYMLNYKLLFVLVFFLVVMSAGMSILSTLCNTPIIDMCKEAVNIETRMPRDEFIGKLLLYLGLMIGLSAISSVASYVYSRIMLKISQKTMVDIRRDLFNHVETLPLKYFDTHKKGEIMSRFTADVSTVSDIINNGFTTLINSGFTLVSTVIVLFVMSPKMTLILFASLIVMLILILVIGALSALQFKKNQKAIAECNGFIEEHIRGQRVVKVFNHEEKDKEEFAELAKKLRRVGIGANTLSGLLSPLMTFVSKASYSICALAGASALITKKGAMSIGEFITYLKMASSFSSPVTSLASQFTSLMSALAGAERIFEVMDMPSEIDEGSVTMVKAFKRGEGIYEEGDGEGAVYVWKIPVSEDNAIYVPVTGEVIFKDVTFGYLEDKTVLHNINIEARPNEKVALVGSTGAGKTTITNLINRFYDITEGSITIDGIEVKSIRKDDLRHALSMVLQDVHLFSGTVMENIRYGRLDATDDEVIEAAKIANAHSFISRLPEGYNTEIKGNGKNLSQGQRQLISIARAAVADPAVLILDEATSSIDTRTEKLIEKGMDSLMEGRTVFVIAHRLSTVRNSDKIMVLEHGEIIESGNHEQLLEAEGKYYQLYNGLYQLD